MLGLAFKMALSGMKTKPFSRVLTIGTVSFVLVVAALVMLLLQSFSGALDDVKASYFMTAYLAPSFPEEKELETLSAAKKLGGVLSAELVGKDSFIANFKKHFPDLAQDLTATDPDAIPRYIKVRVTETNAEAVRSELTKLKGVESVDLNRTRFTGLLQALLTMQRFSLLLLIGAIAALISIFLNHFKLDTIYRSQVIATMRYLGARPSQVHMPFMIEGMLEGALGGILAAVLMFFATSFFNTQIGSLFEALGYSLHKPNMNSIAVALVLAGIASGTVSSLWAVMASSKPLIFRRLAR